MRYDQIKIGILIKLCNNQNKYERLNTILIGTRFIHGMKILIAIVIFKYGKFVKGDAYNF